MARMTFSAEFNRLDGGGYHYTCWTVSERSIGIIDSFDTETEARAYRDGLNAGTIPAPSWLVDHIQAQKGSV